MQQGMSIAVASLLFLGIRSGAVPYDRTLYNAEDVTLSGAVVAHTNSGYSASGYVVITNPASGSLEQMVNLPLAGNYLLEVRYANGGSTASLRLDVDHAYVATISFAPTGGWSTWRLSSTAVSLPAGTHTIALTATGSATPAVDRLEVAYQFPHRAGCALQPKLPDPFLMYNGQRVANADDWEKQRHYLRELLQFYHWGKIPLPPGQTIWSVVAGSEHIFTTTHGQQAHGQTVNLSFYGFTFHIHVYYPTAGRSKYPVVIIQGFPSGSNTSNTKISSLLERGYAVVHFVMDDVASEFSGDRSVGMYRIFPGYDFGACAAWGYACGRIADYLVAQSWVDPQKLVINGWSRTGKSALCGAIMDDRFAICNPNGSGEGGAAVWRFYGNKRGAGWPGTWNPVDSLRHDFPHWLSPELAGFTQGKECYLPHDAHFLSAVIAPRKVISTDGLDDEDYGNPLGTQVAYQAARVVFDFLGVPDHIAAHWREGGHAQNLEDFGALLDFCDIHFYGSNIAHELRNIPLPGAVLSDFWTWSKPGGAFVAYNDLAWTNGQLAVRITHYTRGESGLLVDYATGSNTPVTLTVSAGGSGPILTQGANASAGTDAADVFAGKVDAGGLVGYASSDLVLAFSGLDPARRYEVVLFGNRDVPSYAARTTTTVIGNVATFVNASSAGAAIGTTAVSDDTATIGNGWNTTNGWVARFTQIDPGADGDMTLTVSDNDTKFYVNALMLRALDEAGRGQQQALTVVPAGAVWRYRKGTAEASAPPATWRTAGYDDAAWNVGTAPFGYGDGPYNTALSDMSNNYLCVFLRRDFAVAHPAEVAELQFWGYGDDGFVVWVNGEEVWRVNMPGTAGEPLSCATPALQGVDPAAQTLFLTGARLPRLAPNNMLAVQVFNVAANSSDLTLDMEVAALTGSLLATAADGDGDGMADAWEAQYWGSTNRTGNADADGDGYSNLEEYIAGTSPATNASFLAVVVHLTNDGVQVSVPTVAARGAGCEGRSRHYGLERSAALGGTWSPVTGYADFVGTGQTVTCTNAGPDGAMFYRARVWLE
ncbi:MAG: carbohydrate-binding protein [Kiritimatiellae bacterium]|nr:carbohydrate-binding protein [Kiritimatiellia bacterium]